ncbi:MAG TPA: phytanoyl-CoA dioxygenase family protein [Roseiflexaceae bacterium]|nr:phytanoyl-CoA dioxygenase family protein [Roseiflexaceae bacterium]
MNTYEALCALGVRDDTLTEDDRARLDEDGFLPLYGILAPEQIAAISARLTALLDEEGEQAGTEVHQEAGTDRLSDLVNKDPIFEICFTHPRVLAGIAQVLKGDLKLSSLNSRAALPGEGLQALHADWGGPVAPGDYYVCNSIWLLDDFTERNGATRVVPGTHRSGKAPRDEMPDPKATHPHEKKLLAPAGTVVIFNSHVWHGGTLNASAQPRRALHSYFCRRDQPQQLDQRRYIRPETYARLSEAARYILDV